MELSNVFGGDSLKAADLQGREPTCIISNVEMKKFDNGNKLVITFEGKKKALVCNKTNASIIEEVLGSGDTDDWEGKSVVLVTKKVEFQGKLVPAIRVVLADAAPAPQPRGPRQPEPKPPVDDPARDDAGFEAAQEESSDVPF